MKIQGNGHTLSHFAISMIVKPYSILDPTFGCPQDQKTTKTEKVKLFLEIIPRISPFSEPFLVYTQYPIIRNSDQSPLVRFLKNSPI